MKQLLLNAQIINEGEIFTGSVLIDNEQIAAVYQGILNQQNLPTEARGAILHLCESLWLLPGVIDDQVHFRDPGLTHKGDIESESKAAVAGGVTSFMDMPNTKPLTIDYDALMRKHERAQAVSWANYSFFPGGTNDNAEFLFRLDSHLIPGIKLFLGSSTGNMLVDKEKALTAFFSESPHRLAIHSESEPIIQHNKALFVQRYGEDPPLFTHPLIRSEEACYRSTSEAIERATKYGTRLHVLHLSTASEAKLFEADTPLCHKRITAEVCVHHLWFCDQDYERYGTRIKWNPAIKTEADRAALREALRIGAIDIVATDHAPHLLSEKIGGALKAASGGPLIQYSLLMMLELAQKGLWSTPFVVEKMSHKPAELFAIEKRGYIRPGYYADLVLVNPNKPTPITSTHILSKCGWSPLESSTLSHSISATWVNGSLAYQEGKLIERPPVKSLYFSAE